MKKKNIFYFEDYKKFLQSWVQQSENGGRGVQIALAKALECQPSFVSLMLNDQRDLSLDQALKLSQFLELNENETEYLFCLVQKEKSASTDAKNYFQKKIKQFRENFFQPRQQVQISAKLSDQDQAIYYSNSLFATIRVLTTIPDFQNEDALREKLKIGRTYFQNLIQFLIDSGLIERKGNKLLPLSKELFIDRKSPFFKTFHNNWRLHSTAHIDEAHSEDIHFSMVVSLSKKDHEELRVKLLELLQEFSLVIRKSKEEIAAVIGLDFYEI